MAFRSKTWECALKALEELKKKKPVQQEKK